MNLCLIISDLRYLEKSIIENKKELYYDLINIKDSLKYNRPYRLKDERFTDDCLI